jgi:hypothetical protein
MIAAKITLTLTLDQSAEAAAQDLSLAVCHQQLTVKLMADIRRHLRRPSHIDPKAWDHILQHMHLAAFAEYKSTHDQPLRWAGPDTEQRRKP